MSLEQPELVPTPFVDALVGLASVSRRLGRWLDDSRISSFVAARPELLDAVVGLYSLRATVDRVLSAMASGDAAPSTDDAAKWDREILR